MNNSQLQDGYKLTEVGVIPEDWGTTQIGDSHPFVTSGSRGWAVYYSDQGSLFVRITNLSRESIYLNLEDSKLVKLPPKASEGIRTQLKQDDILISITADIGIVGYVDSNVPEPAYINQHIALVRFNTLEINSKFVSYFLASEKPQKLFRGSTDTGAKAGMSLLTVQKIEFALPPLPEQRSIATALSDMDELLGGLDRLIAKKHDLKQAAMQQLLTGKTRLPEFCERKDYKETEIGIIPEDWEVDKVASFASITTGSRNTQDRIEDGQYPFFVRSQTVEKINSYSFDGEAVLTAGDGVGTGKVFHYINGKFDCHQRVYRISNFEPELDGFFFYTYFSNHFYDRIMSMTAKSSVDSVRMEMIAKMLMPLPPPSEQKAIASILSDMDTEIAAIEQRRNKTRDLKQAMMQELLTGRIRLV